MIHLGRDHLAFEIQIYTIKRKDDDQEKTYYVYICKKWPETNENLNNFDLVYKELEQDELEWAEDIGDQNEDNKDNVEEYLPPEEEDKIEKKNLKMNKFFYHFLIFIFILC